MSEEVILKIRLPKDKYEALKNIARSQGYELPTYYLRSLIDRVVEGKAGLQPMPAPSLDPEYLAKKLERAITDILNPYTAKIDEINRRLAEIIELLESRQPVEGGAEQEIPVQPQQRAWEQRREYQAYQKTSMQHARRQAERPQRRSAISRLREEGVFLEEENPWVKNPERFFQSLEREGAVVLRLPEGRIAVDRELWEEFVKKIGEIAVRDTEQAAILVESSLGEPAGKLFRKLALSGKIAYDEDRQGWVVLA